MERLKFSWYDTFDMPIAGSAGSCEPRASTGENVDKWLLRNRAPVATLVKALYDVRSYKRKGRQSLAVVGKYWYVQTRTGGGNRYSSRSMRATSDD